MSGSAKRFKDGDPLEEGLIAAEGPGDVVVNGLMGIRDWHRPWRRLNPRG